MLPREQRAELVQNLLAARNLTKHAAHNRADISRPAMDKLWDGKDVELEILERFARAFAQDVNEWREHWGYPRVEGDPNRLASQLLEAAEREPEDLTYDPDLEGLTVRGFQGAEGLTERDLESIDRAMRLLIQQKRRHLGHRIEGGEE